MKIQVIDKVKVNIKNLNIRWYLSSQEIWIGNVKEYTDIEKMIEECYGSFKWLYSDADTLLFKKESLIFTSGIIKVNEVINIQQDDLCLTNVNYLEGNIKLNERKNLNYQFSQYTKYFPKQDILMSCDRDFKEEFLTVVDITEDFSFIVINEILVGWILKNSSNHLVKDEVNEINITTKSNDTIKNILVEYIILIKKLNEELTDLKEEKLRDDFKKLYKNINGCTEPALIAIKENIINILEFM